MKALKIHRKRGSNCTVVNVFEKGLIIFSYDKVVGLKIPFEGDLNMYLLENLDKRDKETIAHEITTHRTVTQKELSELIMHFLRNIFSY